MSLIEIIFVWDDTVRGGAILCAQKDNTSWRCWRREALLESFNGGRAREAERCEEWDRHESQCELQRGHHGSERVKWVKAEVDSSHDMVLFPKAKRLKEDLLGFLDNMEHILQKWAYSHLGIEVVLEMEMNSNREEDDDVAFK
jgi:hypothetical protein